MISRLQNKCLVLVLSLLEMRTAKENALIIQRISRKLLAHVLEDYIVENYHHFNDMYNKEYEMECFDHLSLDPRD